jgi:hypothetical protein
MRTFLFITFCLISAPAYSAQVLLAEYQFAYGGFGGFTHTSGGDPLPIPSDLRFFFGIDNGPIGANWEQQISPADVGRTFFAPANLFRNSMRCSLLRGISTPE